jgi:hypothetical protein
VSSKIKAKEEDTMGSVDQQQAKRQTLNIRIKPEERGLIDRAAPPLSG